MLESPSSPGGSLDPSSPNFRANGPNDMGNYYVTMISSNPKVSVSLRRFSICQCTQFVAIAQRNLVWIHIDTADTAKKATAP